MKKKMFTKALAIVMSFFVCGSVVQAQGWYQSVACPGWNNPANFTVGGTSINNYSGQGINITSSDKPCPNPLTGNTGVSSMGSTYTASQLASVTSVGGTCSNIPEQNKQYRIMTELNGYDPNTGNNLPYVPTHFNTNDTTPGAINTQLTRSIRIGDGCHAGSGSDGESGAALNYKMFVTPDNAMMYLYYAIVAENPGHGQRGNPTFVIRVMKKNFAGNWVQISDTMAYYVSPTTSPSSDTSVNCANLNYVTLANPGQTGWHQQGSVLYKDWERACLNLMDYMYDTLQIQVMVYDCIYNAHYAYGYIAGECRPLSIWQSGCQAGTSTDVTVLSVPQGMKNYVWYASEFGAIDPAIGFEPGGMNDYVTWRPLTDTTPSSSRYFYPVQASDFHVTRQRMNGVIDTIDAISNRQTFRCEVTSAIDPDKPYKTYLYTQVWNTKPTMDVDSLLLCDGTAKLWNRSYVPGDPWGVVNDSTRWWFYDDTTCTGTPVATFIGDSASYQYEGSDLRGVRVRTLTYDSTCYSEAIYTLHPNHGSFGDTTAVACDSFTWIDGNTYTASNDTVTFTTSNSMGCDSVITLYLTINTPVHEAFTEVACDSYTWQGATITVSGDYTFLHDDANGCTQVDTLHLTVNYSVETTVTDTAEDSYSWQGTTYTESGTYQWQGTTVEGCDSTVTLVLTITTTQEGIDEPGFTIVRLTVTDGRIIVDEAGDQRSEVRVYDVMGRQYPSFTSRISPFTLPNGVYLVKIGNYPARRVVVIR